jgi:phosphoribosylformylglycinamidine synthase subunit PurS
MRNNSRELVQKYLFCSSNQFIIHFKKIITMKFIAEIDVMPHRELLDPQGKTVANNMKNLNLSGVEDVRIGKHIRLVIAADSEAVAREKVEMACQKLLINPIMENFVYRLTAA